MDAITQQHLKPSAVNSAGQSIDDSQQQSSPDSTSTPAPTGKMEAASAAIGKILKKAGTKDTTVETDVAPAVEHETIKREHETKEQEVVDRERHQHHYHTTVQPLQDREVQSTREEHVEKPMELREVGRDDRDEVKADVEAERNAFRDETVEGETRETKTDEGTVVGEQVHHHLHETVQPVIEKEIIIPSVTHVTKPVKEIVHEGTQNHGVTRKEPISVDEFESRLDGELKVQTKVNGLQAIEAL